MILCYVVVLQRLYSVSSPSEKATLREQNLPTENL